MDKLDLKTLEEIRGWVLARQLPREGALFVFAWAVGVCSAAGIRSSELIKLLGGVPTQS